MYTLTGNITFKNITLPYKFRFHKDVYYITLDNMAFNIETGKCLGSIKNGHDSISPFYKMENFKLNLDTIQVI